MKKLRTRKLTLNRETLLSLQADELRRAAGGDSFQFGCESGSCPNDCGTAGCGTAGCTGTCATQCGESCFGVC
jgi:hypothetical protein